MNFFASNWRIDPWLQLVRVELSLTSPVVRQACSVGALGEECPSQQKFLIPGEREMGSVLLYFVPLKFRFAPEHLVYTTASCEVHIWSFEKDITFSKMLKICNSNPVFLLRIFGFGIQFLFVWICTHYF